MGRKSWIALMVLGTLTQACAQRPDPSRRAAAPREGDGDASYKIELVFQGLTTVSSRQDGTWLLLGNTSDVERLEFSRDPEDEEAPVIAKHEPRLLLPTSPPKGVTITAAAQPSAATMCPPEELDAVPGRWGALPISGKHLTLVGNLNPTATPFEAGAEGSGPCVVGPGCTAEQAAAQAADIRWIRSVPEIFALAGTPLGFREELFKPAYAPEGFPVLAARFFLDKGTVKSSKLDVVPAGSALAQYEVVGVPDWGTRALARQVVVELTAKGPVKLVGRDLSNAGATSETLVTLASIGPTVRVVVGNDASDHDCHGNMNDWVMSYNYLDRSLPPDLSVGPIAATPGPGLHGSCSPDRG